MNTEKEKPTRFLANSSPRT